MMLDGRRTLSFEMVVCWLVGELIYWKIRKRMNNYIKTLFFFFLLSQGHNAFLKVFNCGKTHLK